MGCDGADAKYDAASPRGEPIGVCALDTAALVTTLAAPQTDERASPSLAVAFVFVESLLSVEKLSPRSRGVIAGDTRLSGAMPLSRTLPLSVGAIELRRLAFSEGSDGREVYPDWRRSWVEGLDDCEDVEVVRVRASLGARETVGGRSTGAR